MSDKQWCTCGAKTMQAKGHKANCPASEQKIIFGHECAASIQVHRLELEIIRLENALGTAEEALRRIADDDFSGVFHARRHDQAMELARNTLEGREGKS